VIRVNARVGVIDISELKLVAIANWYVVARLAGVHEKVGVKVVPVMPEMGDNSVKVPGVILVLNENCKLDASVSLSAMLVLIPYTRHQYTWLSTRLPPGIVYVVPVIDWKLKILVSGNVESTHISRRYSSAEPDVVHENVGARLAMMLPLIGVDNVKG